MKMMGKLVMKTTAFFAILTILCGVIYPLVVTGVAQAPRAASLQSMVISMAADY